MPAPPLDRLSALLEGLAPRVALFRPEPDRDRLAVPGDPALFLHLYLLGEGELRLQAAASGHTLLQAPCLALCRSDIPHCLTPSPSASSGAPFGKLLRGRATFDGPVAPRLLHEFAAPCLIPLENADPSLGHVAAMIAAELDTPRCGQPALLNRAGDILFIGLLRHLIAHPQTGQGLLRSLADPRIARALVAIHSHPQHPWTVAALADTAGMSRTAFANGFRNVMGETPARYLVALRLALARRAVQLGKGLKVAAREAGYRNSSALSRALSRSPAPTSPPASEGPAPTPVPLRAMP